MIAGEVTKSIKINELFQLLHFWQKSRSHCSFLFNKCNANIWLTSVAELDGFFPASIALGNGEHSSNLYEVFQQIKKIQAWPGSCGWSDSPDLIEESLGVLLNTFFLDKYRFIPLNGMLCFSFDDIFRAVLASWSLNGIKYDSLRLALFWFSVQLSSGLEKAIWCSSKFKWLNPFLPRIVCMEKWVIVMKPLFHFSFKNVIYRKSLAG